MFIYSVPCIAFCTSLVVTTTQPIFCKSFVWAKTDVCNNCRPSHRWGPVMTPISPLPFPALLISTATMYTITTANKCFTHTDHYLSFTCMEVPNCTLKGARQKYGLHYVFPAHWPAYWGQTALPYQYFGWVRQMRSAGLSNCSALGGTLGGAEVGLGGMRLQTFCRLPFGSEKVYHL